MHYFSGKGCSESLESMHYCIGILNLTYLLEKLPDDRMSDDELELLAPWNANSARTVRLF